MKSILLLLVIMSLICTTMAFSTENPIVAGETFVGSIDLDGGKVWLVKDAPNGIIIDDGLVTWQVPVNTPTGTYSFTYKLKKKMKFKFLFSSSWNRVKQIISNFRKSRNKVYIFEIDVIGIIPLSEGIIGRDGGSVTADLISITIPENAVSTYTKFSINEIDGDFAVVGNSVYTFSLIPHHHIDPPIFKDLIEVGNYILSLKIKPPGDMILTVTGLDSDNYSLITYQRTISGTMEWRYVSSHTSNGVLSAKLDHFSVYSVIKDQSTDYKDDWVAQMDHNDAEMRLNALEDIIDVTFSETDENWFQYVKDASLSPIGDKSCYTSAMKIEEELIENQSITNEFTINIVNTGIIISNVSIPIPHYVVKLDPINNDGPSYIVDRYLGNEIYEVIKSFDTDQINDDSSLFDRLIKGSVEIQVVVKRYDDPITELDKLREQIIELYIYCTLFTGGRLLNEPCQMHDGQIGVHCTIGTWAMCPIHKIEH